MPRSLIRRLLTTVADRAVEETVERIGERLDDESEPRPGMGLDAAMGFLLALVVAGWFGLYQGNDSKAGGPAGIGDDIGFLITRGIGFLIISGICIGLVCALMSQVQSVATKLAIYFGFAIFLSGIHFFSGLREDHRDRAAQTQIVTSQQREEAWQRERNAAAERAALAEASEAAAIEARSNGERDALIARYEQLSATVPVRWREDIEASGATGAPGVIPPMLKFTQINPQMWRLTNLGDKPVCVSVARVIGRAGSWRRCTQDAELACRELGRKASRQVLLRQLDDVPACARGQLEFRVGTPNSPEPSWWTRSALEEFDSRGVDDHLRPQQLSVDHLRGEIALFESMLADKNRAARWRDELGGPER